MKVIAKARHIHMSARKLRLVIDAVRGKRVEEAIQKLQFMNKAAALPVRKLVQSAVANAEHNFKLNKESLFIETIAADGGPIIHRWRARAMGRAAPIRKRTAHITVVLNEKAPVAAKAVKKSSSKKAA